jgi:hypothetical protein
MPIQRLLPGCLAAVVLCGLLSFAGCRDGGDGGYREVTQADVVAPSTSGPEINDSSASGGSAAAGDLVTAAEPDSPEVSEVEPPSFENPPGSPPAGADPVNPLRPALPGNPLRPPLPGDGLGPPLDSSGRRPTPRTTDAPGADPKEPREIKLLVKNKTFKVEGPEKAVRVSYDDFDLLKVLNMEPVPPNAPDHMPEWLKQLDGKRIRVRGFMYPTFQDPVEIFVLARDNQICCFGRNPKIYDLVRVVLRKGVTSPYIQNRPFDVVGLFHIAKKIEDPKLLYSLDDAVVVDR